MAVLKYRDAAGNLKSVGSYKIDPVTIAQGKGDSESAVVSQKAFTDQVNEIDSQISDVKADVEATRQEIGQDYLTKADAESTYIKEHQSLANYATKSEVQTAVSDKATKSEVSQAVAPKADASSVYTKSEIDTKTEALETSIAEKALQEKTYTKTEVDAMLNALAEALSVIDCGTY